jgi:glutathione S-transferase
MMKLYFAPGACSLSPHIALREAGIAVELVKVNLRTKKTEAGDDFAAINPNGYVPVLQLDDGSVLTEGPAIVQYIADRVPEKKLAPANGTLERYRLQSLLNFIGTELHKTCTPIFNPKSGDDAKQAARALLERRLGYVNNILEKGPYLMGEQFSVADGYLFTVLSWTKPMNIDLSPWPRLGGYIARIAARPAVQEALKAEGLM